MRNTIFIIALAFAVGICGCSKNADKPSDVLKLLRDCKSEEEGKIYFTKGTVAAIEELKKLMPDTEASANKKSVDKTDKWEVVSEDIQGDTATLNVKFTASDDPRKVGTIIPFKFKKENGSWKIDMEAELNMALQMIKNIDMKQYMKDAINKMK